jgi:centromeric protein E
VKLRYALITVALVNNRLVIESRESDRDGRENDGAVLVGTLNLVDLAGSESVRNTGATGMRAKEGGNINKSLLALSMVINKLSTQSQHVSYRDSKLTHLLSPSLSGNAKMAIICCITPASNYQDETRSTLQFASGAKLVKTNATVNEVLDEATQIKRLKREVEMLRAATSDEAAMKFKQMQETAKELQEQLRVKDVSAAQHSLGLSLPFPDLHHCFPVQATIEQMRAHYESSASAESKQPSAASEPADRRSSKRHRVDGPEEEEEQEEEGPRSVANIQGTLAQMLARRAAMAGAIPPVVAAAVQCAATTAVPAPQVVVVPAKMEEVKPAPPINPMTLGLRNMLMKELDFKLGARRQSISETTESAVAVPTPATTADAAIVAINEENAALVLQLEAELAQVREEMTARVAAFDETLAERDAAVQNLQEGVTAVNAQPEDQQYAYDALLTKFADAESQIAELQAQLAEATVTKCVDMTVVTSVAEAEAARLQQQDERIAALEQEVAELKESLDASESETLSLLEQLEQSQVGLGAAESTVADKVAEMVAEKEAQLAAAMETATVADAEIARLQSELEAATAAQSDLAAALGAAEGTVTDLQAQVSAHVSTMEELQAEKTAADEAIAALQAARATDSENLADMESKMSEIIDQGLLAEEHLEAARDTVTELQGSLAAAEEKVSELTAELTLAQNATAEAESMLAATQEELARTQTELQTAQNTVSELQTGLQQAVEAAAASAADVEGIAPETVEALESAKEMVSVLEGKITDLEGELQQARGETSALSEQLLAAEAACESQEAKIAELEAALQEATAHAASVVDTMSAVEADKVALQEKVAALEAEIADHEATVKASEEIIAEHEATLLKALEEQQGAETELARVQTQLDEVTEAKAATDEKLAAALEQASAGETELVALREHLTAVEAELQNALKPVSPTGQSAGVARMAEFDMNQESLDATRRDMDRMVGTIRAELGNKEAEVSRLMAALTEARERAAVAEQRLVSMDSAADASDENQLRKRCGQLQTTVDLLNGEKESLLMKLQAAERGLKTREGEACVAVEKLERDCAAWETQVSKLQQDLAQSARLQENAHEVRRRLEDVVIQRDAQQQRADAAADRVRFLEDALEELKSGASAVPAEDAGDAVLREEKLQLQRDLAEIATRLKKSQEASAQLREQWESAEADRLDLQAQLSAVQTEKATLSADLEAALDNINTLTEALEEANEANDAMAASAANAAAAGGIAMVPLVDDNSAEEVLALTEALEAAKAEMVDLEQRTEAERAELAERVASLEQQLVVNDELVQELEKELTATQEQLTEAIEKAASMVEEVTSAQQERAATAEEHQQSTGVCKFQAEQIADLMAQLDTARAASVAAAEEATRLSELSAEKAQLEETVSALQSDLSALRDEMEQRAADAAAELESASMSATEEIAALQQRLDAKSEEVEQTVSELARLQASVEDLQTEVAGLQKRSTSQSQVIEELEGELEAVRQSSAEAASVESAAAELAAVKGELQTTRETLRAANEHCAVNEDMVTSLQEQLQVKEARIQHLETCKLTKEQMEKIKVGTCHKYTVQFLYNFAS